MEKKLNTTQLKDPNCQEDQKETITRGLEDESEGLQPLEHMCNTFNKATFEAAVEVLGYTKRQNASIVCLQVCFFFCPLCFLDFLPL